MNRVEFKFNYKFLTCFLLGLIVFTALQFRARGVFSDPDGFYHAKVSQLLQHGQLTDAFAWLPYTTWAHGFADQHYLYHLVLIPFNTAQALPVSVVVFGLLFFAAFIALLHKLKTPGVVGWVLLMLLGSVDFLFRINLVKANTLSLALMCVTLLLLIAWQQKKSALLAALIALTSFVFVWTYGGFVFLPLLVGGYCLAMLISHKKIDYIPFLAMVGGIAFGLLLHPHAGHLLESLSNQLFQTGLRAGSEVPAGNEWLSYNLSWFIKSNIVVLFLWLMSFAVAVKKFINKDLDWPSLWLQIIAVAFLGLALWHRRFIEYYIPFAVLATAVTLSPYLIRIRWTDIKNAFLGHWQFQIAAVLVSSGVVFSFGWNFNEALKALQDGTKYDAYKGAAEAIAGASAEGDMVINTQWDQFPQLWYWSSKNNYIAGMDPTFLYLQEPEKYWQWRKISDDEPDEWESIEQLHDLAQSLQGKYLFVETARNPEIEDYIKINDTASNFFSLLYEKDGTVVYQVIP